MVADIIIIAVFALLFFIDFKRGIAITILNVAGVALTGFLAYHISNFLASWVYTAFVQQTLTTNLQQMIDTQGINSAIANSFSALPNWVMGMLGFFLSIFGLDSSVYTNDFQVPNSAAAAVSASLENLIQTATLKNLKTAPEIIGLLSISGFENSSTPEKILTAKNTRIAASASPNTPPRSLLICFTTGILNTLAV